MLRRLTQLIRSHRIASQHNTVDFLPPVLSMYGFLSNIPQNLAIVPRTTDFWRGKYFLIPLISSHFSSHILHTEPQSIRLPRLHFSQILK